MESLLKALESVGHKLERYEDLLRRNEALTRYALIDPVLRALGWDTEDPSKVIPEFSTQSGVPDYALLWEGEPFMMVEAKAYGEDLTAAKKKGFAYCWENKVRYYTITDGSSWEIYDIWEPGGKLLVQTSLKEDSLGEVARKLLALWYPAVPEVKEAEKPLILSKLRDREDVQKPPLKVKQVPLSSLQVQSGDSPPHLIIFPDGKSEELKYWRDILLAVAKWALPQLKRRLPIDSGTHWFLINTEPVHKNKKPFKSPVQIGDYWLETNFSAERCARLAIHMLDLVDAKLKESVLVQLKP